MRSPFPSWNRGSYQSFLRCCFLGDGVGLIPAFVLFGERAGIGRSELAVELNVYFYGFEAREMNKGIMGIWAIAHSHLL